MQVTVRRWENAMSPDGAVSATTLTALSNAAHSDNGSVGSANDAVIDAIRAHHAQLAEQLRVRTDAVFAAAQADGCSRERDDLHRWYQTELMPTSWRRSRRSTARPRS